MLRLTRINPNNLLMRVAHMNPNNLQRAHVHLSYTHHARRYALARSARYAHAMAGSRRIPPYGGDHIKHEYLAKNVTHETYDNLHVQIKTQNN